MRVLLLALAELLLPIAFLFGAERWMPLRPPSSQIRRSWSAAVGAILIGALALAAQWGASALAWDFGGPRLFFVLRDTAPGVAFKWLLEAPAVILVLMVLAVRREPLRTIGISSDNLRVSVIAGLAYGAAMLALSMWAHTIAIGASQAYGLLSMLAVGISEEMVFRGYLQTRLSWSFGPRTGWLAAAVLFALVHLVQPYLQYGFALPGRLVSRFVGPFAFGLVYGWVMRRTGNVTVPILFHTFANWVSLLS